MLKKALSLTFVLVCAAMVAASFAQGEQDKLKQSLAWLHKIQVQFSPDVRAMVPSLEAVLERYFQEPATLRQSERDLAEAFLATMPATGEELGGRGSQEERMKDFEALLGSTPKKPAAPPKAHSPKPTPPPKPAAVRPPKAKIPGIASKPTFAAIEKQAPGGKRIGAVVVSISGRKKTVVEIFSTTPGYTLQRRAAVIAGRMRSLSASNPLWWTTVKPGNARGEVVVRAAGAPILVTADRAFADECGMTPDQLARQLATKIRTTFDAQSGDEFGGRDLTPDQMRQAAIDLRQEGDDVYSASAAQAEAKYKLAIQNDASYHVPYLRLADLYKAQGKVADARAILDEGLKNQAIVGSQRAELEGKRRALGA